MRSIPSIFVFVVLSVLFSCKNSNEDVVSAKKKTQTGEGTKKLSPIPELITVDAGVVSKDFATWYAYTYTNIRLAQDFIGLDVDSSVLQKDTFLNRLETGNFIPLKIGLQQHVPIYKLVGHRHSNKDIRLTIQQMATTEKEHLIMEGKTLPAFDFVDLNGKQYTNANTRGKSLLVKCWFITCFACVQEFPELNKLVDGFQGNDDLLFISLASDSQQALTAFLRQKPFRYAVVPNQGIYMSEKLRITAYPTHLLVDKSGKIRKVTNSIDDMLPFIERLVGKASR